MIEEMPGDLLQWLRGFYFVAEAGSITKATTLMGREQPTITRQIKCLEKDLSVTLFDRSSGKMNLTPEGRILLERAISLFEDVNEIRNLFKNSHPQYQGNIVIATSHSLIDSFLPKYIIQFKKVHPKIKFHLIGGVFETVFEKIESAEADFGIAIIDSIPMTMVGYELFESGMKLIAAKKSMRFKAKQPTLAEITNFPLIVFSLSGSMDPFLERRFAQERLAPNIVMTHNNFSAVKKYVAMGMGVALLSGYAVSEEDKKDIDIFSMDHSFPKRKYGIVFRKKKYISPAVKAFIETINPNIQL